jgi:transmembrane sensor
MYMITQQLLQRYFDGRCTPQESAAVLDWLKDDNADHALLHQLMESHWDQEPATMDGEPLKAELWREIRQQLYTADQPARVVPIFRQRRTWYAAAVVAVLLMSLWVWDPGHYRSANSGTLAQWDSVVNHDLHKKQFTLPDSSKIWLASGGRLLYNIRNEHSSRQVQLDGEAFFDVAQDAKRPFILQSGPVQTRVLGTAFNVEAYAQEKEIRIALVQGRVAIQRNEQMLADLHSGEMLTWSASDSITRKENLRYAHLSDYTSNKTVFNDIPVAVALERLARRYRWTLHFEKGVQLDSKRFSTVFEQETPEQMVRNILFITDYHYKFQGNVLFITN